MANAFDRFDGPGLPTNAQGEITAIPASEVGQARAAGIKVNDGAPTNPFDRFDQAAPQEAPKPVPVAPERPELNPMQRRMMPRYTQPGTGMRDNSAMPYEIGGLVAEQAGRILPAPIAGGLGVAGNMAAGAVDMFAGGGIGKTVGRIAAPPVQNAARGLMQSALKPSMEEIRSGKATKAVQTMLDEGIGVTKGGVEKLKSKISTLNDQIKSAIASSTATVDVQAAASELQGLLKRVVNQVTPQADMATVKRAWDEFLAHPLFNGQSRIPVQQAQELKQGTYRELGGKAFGELKGADTEAQKTLARGLKEQIAKEVPGIDMLNKKESDLLNALTPTEHRVISNLNKNPGGLGWLISNPFEFVAFMADRSPSFKSLIARMMYSGTEAVPRSAGQVIGGGVGAYGGMDPGQIPPPP